MDNNFLTGNPKFDYVLLGIGWGGVAITPSVIPIILSSIASVLVIYNQWNIAKKKKQ